MAKSIVDPMKIIVTMKVGDKWLISRGLEAQDDIKRSMKKGTGNIYMKGKNKNIVHIASAPGQPPAVDTGRLRASISTNWAGSGKQNGDVEGQAQPGDGIGMPELHEDKFKVVVGTKVDYAPWLEFGTSAIAERPFMRPAYDRIKARMK